MSHFSVAVFTGTKSSDAVEKLLAPFAEYVKPGDPIAVFEADDSPDYDIDPITGERGYWFNPDARWDWYVIGGRFAGALTLNERAAAKYKTSHVDSAKVSECDFSPTDCDVETAKAFWALAVEGKTPPPGIEVDQPFYKPKYYKDRYGDLETYIRMATTSATYAFITPNGNWHAPGDIGWFGLDDATAESVRAYLDEWDKYIKEAAAKRLYVTIVDCHI